MTFDEADLKVKLLFNDAYATVAERETRPGSSLKFWVGLPSRFGIGATWEAAFENIKPCSQHVLGRPWRKSRSMHKCAKCCRPRVVVR